MSAAPRFCTTHIAAYAMRPASAPVSCRAAIVVTVSAAGRWPPTLARAPSVRRGDERGLLENRTDTLMFTDTRPGPRPFPSLPSRDSPP
eukprot:scaffold85518_cov37-Tisochrysis_lutea.AAC.2